MLIIAEIIEKKNTPFHTLTKKTEIKALSSELLSLKVKDYIKDKDIESITFVERIAYDMTDTFL